MQQKLKELSREKLTEILCEVTEILSEEQYKKFERILENAITDCSNVEETSARMQMSQEFVEEKLSQIKVWMKQIEEGELYLTTEEYEEYYDSYWDSDWIIEYYDNENIGDKLMTAIRFAKDCIDDQRYTEANFIYKWLWSMYVCTDSEDGEPIDLERLVENQIINVDMKQLALLTLYAEYQIQQSENRAEALFLYFGTYEFQQLHIEEMFHMGREELKDTDRFLRDWIALLQTKGGDVAARLLQEAVLYREGVDGLIKLANENGNQHPSLYLAAIKEYERKHEYTKIEEVGQNAMENLDCRLTIRSQIALDAARASDFLTHTEEMMRFCWESFHSDSISKNLLRLFGAKEMAERYGLRGKDILENCKKEENGNPMHNLEMKQNYVEKHTYLELCFYTGQFSKVKAASKNPVGSLGWSGKFIEYGIRLILLYLYEKPLPSKAASEIANYVDCENSIDELSAMSFERKIIEESSAYKTSVFWNYFQRWKQYFPMEQKEKEKYLTWAEKIIYDRADALVGGQYRSHYAEAAQLLAMVGEVRESMGAFGAKKTIFVKYKCKFPRHSSFQQKLKQYFICNA